MMGRPSLANMFTTMMDESTVVLGSYERLNRTLLELEDEYHPSHIVIVDSTIAAIIGVDVRGACEELQDKIAAQLIPFEGRQLLGSMAGGVEAARLCLKRNHIVDLTALKAAVSSAKSLLPHFLTGQYHVKI